MQVSFDCFSHVCYCFPSVFPLADNPWKLHALDRVSTFGLFLENHRELSTLYLDHRITLHHCISETMIETFSEEFFGRIAELTPLKTGRKSLNQSNFSRSFDDFFFGPFVAFFVPHDHEDCRDLASQGRGCFFPIPELAPVTMQTLLSISLIWTPPELRGGKSEVFFHDVVILFWRYE